METKAYFIGYTRGNPEHSDAGIRARLTESKGVQVLENGWIIRSALEPRLIAGSFQPLINESDSLIVLRIGDSVYWKSTIAPDNAIQQILSTGNKSD